jgi:quinol monooxygenase YgiN
MAVIVLVERTAMPGHEGRVQEIARSQSDAFASQPACITSRVFLDTGDPHIIVISSVWMRRGEWTAWWASPACAAIERLAAEHQQGLTRVNIYEEFDQWGPAN